jgi:hypothetical protein
MPSNKDLKRLVRGRMQKTREAYTTARAQILERKSAERHHSQPAASDYAKLAGKSNTITVGFTKMGADKSQVALTHAKLPDQGAVARARLYWTERLAALETGVTGARPRSRG